MKGRYEKTCNDLELLLARTKRMYEDDQNKFTWDQIMVLAASIRAIEELAYLVKVQSEDISKYHKIIMDSVGFVKVSGEE